MNIERCVNSIGKACLVSNFEDFEKVVNGSLDDNDMVQILLKSSKKSHSVSGQKIRINYAKSLFKNKADVKSALSIISKSKRLDASIVDKANKILAVY